MKAIISLALIVVVSSFVQTNAEKVYNKPPCPCDTDDEVDPVCGSDGKTYLNKSVLGCQSKCGYRAEFVKNGRCDAVLEPSCPCPTTRNVGWVCGDDGKSYINESTLKCSEKCGNGAVKVVSKWFCPESDSSVL